MNCFSHFQRVFICHTPILSWLKVMVSLEEVLTPKIQRFEIQCDHLCVCMYVYDPIHLMVFKVSVLGLVLYWACGKSGKNRIMEMTTPVLKQRHVLSTNKIQVALLSTKPLTDTHLPTATNVNTICQKQQLKWYLLQLKKERACSLPWGIEFDAQLATLKDIKKNIPTERSIRYITKQNWHKQK